MKLLLPASTFPQLSITAEPSPWRMIFLSFTFGITSESIISLKTAPHPTLSSWSGSPLRISFAPDLTAFKRWYIRSVSTIDISSTIISFSFNGFSSFLPASSGIYGFNSSIICIVEDSCPECSFSTPAARAVGAHSRISSSGCLFLKRSIAPQIVCVFPVPPRPRSKTTLFLSKLFRNSSCSLLYLSLIDSNTSSFVPISVFICINLLIWNAISASLSIVRINPSMPYSQYTLFISTRVAKR